MANRKISCLCSGAILCLGALSFSDKLLAADNAFAAGPGVSEAGEPTATGGPQILGPRMSNLAAPAWQTPTNDPELRSAFRADAIEPTRTTTKMPSMEFTPRAASRDGYPAKILVQSPSANMATHGRTPEAEPLSAIEFAIADFIDASRAAAQFVVGLFVGSEPLKLVTPDVQLSIEDPMSVSRGGTH